MALPDNIAKAALEAARGSVHDAKAIVARAGLFSETLAACCADIAPYDYQAGFIDDYASRATIWRKPRQIGGSRALAMKAVGKQLAFPKSGSLHLSLNMEDAEEKISYALEIYERLADEVEVPRLTVKNKTELAFENGSTIQAVFDPRGKPRKDIYADEFAHHPHARKIYRSMTPILVRGGLQLAIASTVISRNTLFSEIWHEAGGQYQRFRRITTHWWDSPAHCRDVARARREAPGMPTAERVKRFGTAALRDLFDMMLLEDFQCEFELVEIGDEDAWLPWDLILSTTPAGEDAVRNLDPMELRAYLAARPKAACFAGYDVGRIHDTSEFSALVAEDGRGWERCTVTFARTDFETQKQFLREYLANPRTWVAIDETGLGMMLAENLKSEFRRRVMPVNFASSIEVPTRYQDKTAPAKTALAVVLKQAMLDDEVRWQIDKQKNAQMYSVRRTVTASSNLVFTVEQGEGARHHADVFWARALAVWCWKMSGARVLRVAAVV